MGVAAKAGYDSVIDGPLETMAQLFARANASGADVDILKMDCEARRRRRRAPRRRRPFSCGGPPPLWNAWYQGCEWTVMLDEATLELLSAHVVQLLIELHYSTAALAEALAEKLTAAGFRAFSKEPNIEWSDGSCVEYSLLNVRKAAPAVGRRRRSAAQVEDGPSPVAARAAWAGGPSRRRRLACAAQ